MSQPFRLISISLGLILLASVLGCSSEPTNQNTMDQTTNTSKPKQLEPLELRIGLTHNSPKAIFEDVYKQNKESLGTIKDLNFEKLDPSTFSTACNSELDMLFLERQLSESEKQTCQDQQFEPIGFKLGTMRTTGDTIYLYTREKRLNRRDVRSYLKSISEAMAGPLPNVTRYESADTDIINRNRGLLSLYES